MEAVPQMIQPNIYSPTQLANYMRLVRQKNRWTQSELAKRIGIKQATISNFENNPDKATVTTLFKILQSLDMVMVVHEKGDKVAEDSQNYQGDIDW